MARKKTLMERIDTIHTLSAYMESIDEVSADDIEGLKNIVIYQYEYMTERIGDRWDYASRNDKANLRRLYRDIMAGKFD
jgi:hypothetical protein